MRSVAFGLQSLQSRGSRRTFGSSGWRTRTTTSPRSMRNKYARTTFGDKPWRRTSDSDSQFRRSFPSRLSVLSLKIVSQLQSRGRAKRLMEQEKSGAPGGTRTPDLLVRSQTLYPTELRAHSNTLNVQQFTVNSSMISTRRQSSAR